MSSLSAVYPEREEAQQRRIHFVESSTTPKLNRARLVVRCFIWTLILLFLAISVCSVIVWFVLHPRVPVIQINSLSVSNVSLLDRHVRADADQVGFTVINNNWKIDLCFERFNVLLSYKNHEISKSYFEPFSLQKRNETSKNIKFALNSGFHGKGKKTAIDLSMDMSRKEVSFSVSMEGLVFITSGNWYSKWKWMEIYCKDLKVEFSENGTGKLYSDEKHDCSVHFA